MVKKALIVSLLFLVSCKKTTQTDEPNRFVLSISIDNVANGTTLYLRKQEDKLSIDLDSTTIKNGMASFEGSIRTPEVYGIFIDGQTSGIFPIIEKGEISIKADAKALEQAEINGSFLNDQLTQYKNRVAQILSKTNAFYHEFQKARAENNLDALNQVNERIKDIQKEKVNYAAAFVKEHPNSFVSTMVLHSLVINKELDTEALYSLFDQLAEGLKKNEFSKAIIIELQLDSLKNSTINP